MKRGSHNGSRKAIPKKRGSGQSASSTASAANVPSSTPETNVDKVAWILYRARMGLGGPAPYSKEFLYEVMNAANEGEGGTKTRSAAEIDDLVQGIQERLMSERADSKIPPEGVPLEYMPSGGSAPGSPDPLNLETRLYDGNKVDHNENEVVITTIPLPKGNMGERDPDGDCQWIFNGGTKAKVVQAPGYPARVPNPTERKITIQKTETMGIGLVATKDLKMGELIFAERPILAMPIGIGRLRGPDSKVASSQKHSDSLAMLEWEQMLRDALDRMTIPDRKAFMRLRNSHKDDGCGPLWGIVRTNGFHLDGIFDGPELKKDETNVYTGVLKIGSYINHSCTPNIHRKFTIPSFSFQFYASVDIKAGQELFVAYCDIDMTVAERRKKLAPYGFTCRCDACEHATKETDKLRREYKSKTERLLRALNWQRREGKKVAQSAIDPIVKLKNTLAKEGLVFTHEYKSIMTILSEVFEELGQMEVAKEYKVEAERFDLPRKSLVKYGVEVPDF